MISKWKKAKGLWAERTSLPAEVKEWAIESIKEQESAIENIELFSSQGSEREREGIEESLKILRKSIKSELTSRENELDDLTLNTPNSYKLQISVPSNLNYLMKAWAAAEGRDLSSVALQCMETGLREIQSKGAIPKTAIKRYEDSCDRRIALAEVNCLWERHQNKSIKE